MWENPVETVRAARQILIKKREKVLSQNTEDSGPRQPATCSQKKQKEEKTPLRGLRGSLVIWKWKSD